ncbi:hypothetical protein Glove_21g102 [Diversispora epigaea]|uniref:Protein kinase domain-containing protein n=1 Tax=Diversispora epigaea TaxID=1348612 RepID=A0A397JK51_9GLOM|nr:hypothetical protein Glove_21g102 [Diversispora epigaea]
MHNEALLDFNNLLEKKPNNYIALELRGETYQKLEMYNHALTDFNKLLRIRPNNTLALILRGKTYQKLKKHNKALLDFNNLLELDPNNTLALRLRGETYQKLEKHNKALLDFNNLLELDPNNTLALRLRGETYQKLEKHNKALLDFNNLLELDPNNTLSLRLRGETYQKLEKYNEALIDFNKFLEIQPNNTLALISRGETYKMLNRYKESLDDFNKILKINSDDVSIINIVIEIEKSRNDSMTDTTQKQQTGSRMVQSIKTESSQFINWIPFSQFKDIKYIAEGGFGVVNGAIWIKDGINEIKVALKNLHNSKDMADNFLKEVISHGITSSNDFILQCYGITKDPNTNNNIIVMEFAEDGSLHSDLRRNINEINWQTKLERLYCIATGIEQIHNNNLIHRDLHSGNILMGVNGILGSIRIADLGLCRNIGISTDFVYGIIPYVAPEIFKDSSYSQASDVYSFGMLMWEFTSGHRPFFNRSHNQNLIHEIIGGLRPEFTDDTPKVFIDLMKSCWDSNALNRPIITEIREKFNKWCWGKENEDQFIRAENLRISTERKGNNYDSYHPEATYMCRLLNPMISLSKLTLNECKEPVSQVEDYKSIQEDFEIDFNT